MFIITMPLLFQAKYNVASLERENIRQQNSKMEIEICDLKETLDRRVASNKIEVRLTISAQLFFVYLLQLINLMILYFCFVFIEFQYRHCIVYVCP